MPEPPLRFGDIVIVGGGCYGKFYTTQLIEAREKGKLTYRHLLVVDQNPDCQLGRSTSDPGDYELVVQDWDVFFDGYLIQAAEENSVPPNSVIVPSPLMPHLMYRW
ncbi:MAG: hypothetical protein HKM89_12195, partial [Gemmatimonadales bacterium]|nr:hypothetical protein [Gemmatimonadales bacterium]